jgi:hypothetical protein
MRSFALVHYYSLELDLFVSRPLVGLHVSCGCLCSKVHTDWITVLDWKLLRIPMLDFEAVPNNLMP